ncbi:cache domain-containing protein [Paenibacillus hodogayensis]|uniref:Cache domain-containing protein n=1 Tax=Paenibacillus hodogayensis TaxID=279208 RepID=A0ABV5W2V0_9BACL
MKFGITGRIMLLYGGVLLLVISLTFLFSYMGTVGRLEQQLNNTNMALLKQIDQKIETSFRQTETNLLQLTNELEFVYFMNDSYKDDAQKYANFFAINNKLTQFLNNNVQFSSVFVYSDVSGDIYTDKVFTNKSRSENSWIAQYLNMPDYFQWLSTHRIWDGYVNRDVVTLLRSYPALSAPGYRKGLVAANIDVDVLYRMIHDIYDEEFKGHTFILDTNGEVIAHDDNSKLYGKLTELPYIQQVLAGKDSGFFSSDIDGVKQTVSYKLSAYTGWKIVNIVPKSHMYRPLTVTRNLLAIFAAVMFVLAFVVIFFINKRTFTPIDRMIGKLSRAYKPTPPHGDHAPALEAQGVSYLERIFDQMFVERENLEKQVRDSKPMLKWRIVMDILGGYRTDYVLAAPHLDFSGVRLHPERYVVCTAEIGKEGGIRPEDRTLYTYALCNVAEEVINQENMGAAIDLGGGRVVIVFSFAAGDEEQNHFRATALLEQVLDVMVKQFGLTVIAGLGRGCRELKDIPVSYAESQQALQYRMITGHHAVISILDVQPPDNQDYYRIVQRIDRIVDSLKQGDIGKRIEQLRETFEETVKSNMAPELIRQFSFELVMRSTQMMESIGIDTEQSFIEIGNLHERINGCESWKEMERIVDSVLSGLAGRIELKRSQRGKNDNIGKILQYIEENYRDSGLSLDRLAEEFDLHPTYISKLFKEQVEDNFIDYLIKIRIEAAKELLKDKTIKINDISDSIGYTYSRSFTRTFKKYTGLTPTEYRDNAESGRERESVN